MLEGLQASAATRGRVGVAVTDGYGSPIPTSTALRLSDQAEINTAALNHAGAILTFGRDRRIATATQRRAVTARDKGCSFPTQLARPATTTQTHTAHDIPQLPS